MVFSYHIQHYWHNYTTYCPLWDNVGVCHCGTLKNAISTVALFHYLIISCWYTQDKKMVSPILFNLRNIKTEDTKSNDIKSLSQPNSLPTSGNGHLDVVFISPGKSLWCLRGLQACTLGASLHYQQGYETLQDKSWTHLRNYFCYVIVSSALHCVMWLRL